MSIGNGDVILCIINLLFIPLIALRYYCKRLGQIFDFSPENIYRYALIATFNLPAARFILMLLDKFMSASITITTGGQLGAVLPLISIFTQLQQNVFSAPVNSVTYTVFALISSFLLVLFIELTGKTFSFDIRIEKKQKKEKLAKKAETAVENETKN